MTFELKKTDFLPFYPKKMTLGQFYAKKTDLDRP